MDMHEEFKKAETLEEVFETFDPDWELPPDCPFIVPLHSDPLVNIMNKLKIARRNPVNLFFTGHRGAGKTVQVYRLIEKLENHSMFLPFYLDIKSTFDPINLEYTDIIFGIVSSVYESYTNVPSEENLMIGYDGESKLTSNVKNRFKKWGEQTIKETKQVAEMGAGLELSTRFFPWLKAKLKASKETATISRKIIESTIDDLIKLYNDLVSEIEKEEKKKVIVIIDGMDKIDYSKAKSILTLSYDKLLQPQSSLIYVIPVSVSYQMNMFEVEEKICRIDNCPIFDPPGQFEEFNDKAKEFCEDVIYKRLEKSKNLIPGDALREFLKTSAGVVRLLISTVQKSSEKARERNSQIIEPQDVEKVSKDQTYFFKQVLTYSEDFQEKKRERALKICKEIKNSPCDIPMDDIIGPLVHNLMVIEYPDSPRQYGLNPAILPLIK
ncbi:hypothetical protein ES703_120906 [subsurface metagenome]